MEGRSGKEDDVRTGVVPSCPAEITRRLRAWHTSFDGHTVSYVSVSVGRRNGSIYSIMGTNLLSIGSHLLRLRQLHPQTHGLLHTSAGKMSVQISRKKLISCSTSSVTTIESPIRPCCQKCTSLLSKDCSVHGLRQYADDSTYPQIPVARTCTSTCPGPGLNRGF